MRKKIGLLILAGILFMSLGFTAEQKKKTEQKKKETKEEIVETKLYQLDRIIVDVIEKIRDIDIPNMTVVKTELFPMSIGTTLDTALERQAGVDVQRIQEVGTAVDDDSIRIRGMGSRRIKVLKNGRLLNTSGVAGGYFIDWTMIPLHNVDRLEVVKGVGDPRWGNILGGIINLVPRRIPSESPLTEVQYSTSSFGTSSVNIFHAYKPGAFEYSVAAGATGSDGYLKNGSLNFGNFEFHLGYDLSTSGRITADITYSRIRKGFVVSTRSSGDPDDPLYSYSLDSDYPASDGEYMYGGMGAYPEPGSWWKKTKWMFDLGYVQSIGEGGLFNLHIWKNHGDREAYNTRVSLGRIFHKTFYDDRSYGFSADFKQSMGDHSLSAGVEYAYLKDDGDTNHDDDFRAPFRIGYYVAAKNLDFYVMTEIRLLDNKLTAVPGVRYLSYKGVSGPGGISEGIPDISMDGWAPSLKLTYTPNAENQIYVSVSRALRMPAPPEHYWHYDFDDAGVDTSGLPFHEEDGLMLQAGWKWDLRSGTRVEVAPYYYRIKNYIQFDLINFVAYNIEKARLYGIELELAQQFSGGWSAFANYTLQKSRTWNDPFIHLFVSSGDRLFDEIPGLPMHKVNVGIQYKAESGASIAVFLLAVSGQDVVYNSNQLWNTDLRIYHQDAYQRVDIEARYPVTRLFNLGLFVRNLLNETYQERYGFPAAGRTLGLSLKAGF